VRRGRSGYTIMSAPTMLAVSLLRPSNGDGLDPAKLAAVRERTLPLQALCARNGGLQVTTLAAVISALECGAPLAPIKVLAEPDGGFRITDGHHRYTAALCLGIEHMPCLVLSP
jgi:hypothetical protein